jgi:myo-inositol-1(or 4)-monophosphatase
MNVANLDLAVYREIAIDVAEEAGRIIRGGFGEAIAVDAKGQTGDVVTSLDKAAEGLIVERLQAAFPGHRIVSEEAGSVDGPSGAGPWTWLVDPLDGTNNIVVGLPVATVGLALCYEGRPAVGVVHEPFVRRTWSAELGGGAWQAGEQPLLRRPPGERKPVVAWSQGYRVTADDRTALALRAALTRYARRVLELWAPLCCWAMLARGDIDGIVGYQVGELDLHAGALIASMTGVEIRGFDGRPFDLRFRGLAEDRCLVAAPPERMDELLAIASRRDGEYRVPASRVREH